MNTQALSDSREQAFLAQYDPRQYAPVAVTVDVAVLTIREGELSVLLVQRAAPPYANSWCLPGGFLTPASNGAFPDLVEAAADRLARETGLDSGSRDATSTLSRIHLEQLGSYGTPGRDPRMQVVSVAYVALAPDLPEPAAGEGALDARWVPTAEALELPLAFDHVRILADAVERVRGKLEYTSVGTAFLPEQFTIGQLQKVYEAVWNEKLTPSVFRRKVHATAGFVEATGEHTERGGAGGGPRAALYRAGGRALLHPPIEREETTARRLGLAVKAVRA